MQLTEHFADTELGVAGAPAQAAANAKQLCTLLLEPIRAHFGGPVDLSCGLRQPADNAEVGGKLNSQHLYLGGNSAADIEQLPVTLPEAFDWIRLESGLPFDQLILEYENSGDGCRPGCLHISYNSELATQRREALTGSTGNGLIYTQVASWPGAARSMNG